MKELFIRSAKKDVQSETIRFIRVSSSCYGKCVRILSRRTKNLDIDWERTKIHMECLLEQIPSLNEFEVLGKTLSMERKEQLTGVALQVLSMVHRVYVNHIQTGCFENVEKDLSTAIHCIAIDISTSILQLSIEEIEDTNRFPKIAYAISLLVYIESLLEHTPSLKSDLFSNLQAYTESEQSWSIQQFLDHLIKECILGGGYKEKSRLTKVSFKSLKEKQQKGMHALYASQVFYARVNLPSNL